MIFNFNEATKNAPDKSKLPKDPKQFIEQKWKKRDLTKFVNSTDTNRLKTIVSKIVKSKEEVGGFKELNKLNAAINKSEATAVRIYKSSDHDAYYIAPLNAIWELMTDPDEPAGYFLNRYEMELTEAIEMLLEDEGK